MHLIDTNRGIRECLQEIDVDVIACLMQAVLEVVRVEVEARGKPMDAGTNSGDGRRWCWPSGPFSTLIGSVVRI